MATYTENYNLKKPATTDPVNIEDLNGNADIIDAALHEAAQSKSAVSMIETSSESTSTATHAYSIGDYFICNDTLYRATAAIAVGDTITPGTNCAATTAMAELEAQEIEISGKVDKEAGKGLSTLDFTVADRQAISNAYVKPTAGVPKTDLSQDVQTSLDKADNSLQAALDETLTVQGAAADAKATGDAVGELKSAFTQEVGQLVFSGTHSYVGGSENWQTFTPTPNTKIALRIPNNNGASIEVALYVTQWIVVDTISDDAFHAIDIPANVSNKMILTYRGASAVTIDCIAVDVTNANVVGDILNIAGEISNINTDLNTIKVYDYFALTNWANGYIRTSGYIGSIGSSTTSVVSGVSGANISQVGDGNTYQIIVGNGWKLSNVGEYSSNEQNSFTGFVDTTSGSLTLSNTKRYVFSIEKDPESTITPSDITPDAIRLVRSVFTDDTLSQSGKPADAKAVGDAFLTPLTSLPVYISRNLAYKPLGQLEKPYLCLVSDDGNALLNTYTIPMVLSKGVPCTFALMSASDVMQTQADIDIVKNAIENGGCSVAQHGEHYWTTYNETELNQFFDTEKAFFDNAGITLEGAVLPGHYANDMVLALTGGRFGVVRSGYSGEHGGTFINYNGYASGARSNLFCLTSYNINDATLASHKARIDYAVANNKLLFIYWHENSLTDANKATLEGLIDYAKTTSINFCTLGDILKTVV